MSMLTIELSDTMTRQIQNKGISQQQLEAAFIRAIQAYLDETLPVIVDDERMPRPVKTLRDLRGSIRVSRPQDFNIIRQQIIGLHVRERMRNGY